MIYTKPGTIGIPEDAISFAPVIINSNYIEYEGKKYVLGVDVDAKQPWYTYQDAGISKTVPNLIYHLSYGIVKPPSIMPIKKVFTIEPTPQVLAQITQPVEIPSTVELVKSITEDTQAVAVSQANIVSPKAPNWNYLLVGVGLFLVFKFIRGKKSV